MFPLKMKLEICQLSRKRRITIFHIFNSKFTQLFTFVLILTNYYFPDEINFGLS